MPVVTAALLLAHMLGWRLEVRVGRALWVAVSSCPLVLRLLAGKSVCTAGALAPRVVAL